MSNDAFCVSDWVEGTEKSFALALPLHPTVRWDDPWLTAGNGERFALTTESEVSAIRGSEEPFDGWWSDTYGAIEPATRLEWQGMTKGPVAWSIGPTHDIFARRDSRLVVQGCAIMVRFFEEGVELDADFASGTSAQRIEFPR